MFYNSGEVGYFVQTKSLTFIKYKFEVKNNLSHILFKNDVKKGKIIEHVRYKISSQFTKRLSKQLCQLVICLEQTVD